MSELKKEDIIINLFDKENENNGNATIGKPFVKKLIIHDLTNSEITTFNPFDADNLSKMMKNKEIRTIIYDFYESQQVELDLENVEAECRKFMLNLFKELDSKDENEGLDDMENILFLFLSNDLFKYQDLEYLFSDELVNEFKNVLKVVL